MSALPSFDDINTSLDGHVAVVEIARPPHNFFDFDLIGNLATIFEAAEESDDCRAIVLCAQGKSFCAGANFGSGDALDQNRRPGQLYIEAVRLFRTATPIVGAIQGAAIGGGLGLALVPDFRVACPEARFSANFTRLGFHPGFGLTHTLPALIGQNKAALMFYTSRRIKGEEALDWGLADVLVPQAELREAAIALAREIAECSPLGVVATRKTMREGLADRVKAATDHELEQQEWLRATADFQEGVQAMAERRAPNFQGR